MLEPTRTTSGGGGSDTDTPRDLNAALLKIASLDWQEGPAGGMESALEGVGEDWGAYSGLPPKVELLDDGRGAHLLAPIAYRRPDGSDWPVPTGAWLDGASIPRPFWSLIGGPFEGRYRNASIVHDHYCITKDRPWRDVHRMFYEAMRCSGVGPTRAKIMYYSVYRFGPRWAGIEEALEAVPPAAFLSDAEAPSLAADAEAIHVLDLAIDEIEALADVRNADSLGSALEGPADPAAERARLLVVPGGSGTREDFEAVARDAALLPVFVIGRFEKKKIRIIACRGSVTDFEKDLRGVTPRGWPAGKTWDNVPGAYFPDRKRVVIATIASGGLRAVPTKASGLHGSDNLIVHESLHGYDYIRNHKPLKDKGFVAARKADFNRLGTYERQEGRAGLEETFAESGAKFVAAPEALRATWPNLHAFWSATAGDGGLETVAPALEGLDAEEAPAMAEAVDAEEAIGTAEYGADGAILLDLRAEDESGAIGHAVLTLAPEDEAYGAIREMLAGGPAEEAAGGEPVLFRPARVGWGDPHKPVRPKTSPAQ